jgi:hypothetical protein
MSKPRLSPDVERHLAVAEPAAAPRAADIPGASSGVERYVAAAEQAARRRAADIATIRQCRFDTIAVHGLYTMGEALDFNQGSIIEPIFMSTSQAYRDADEMEAALSYQIPTWCYSRIANPSLYYLENVLALLEGYGFDGDTSCCATSSGMAAIASATEPFLALDSKAPRRPMNFVSMCQVYGGTFQLYSVRRAGERNIECRWIVDPTDLEEWQAKIDENTARRSWTFAPWPSWRTLTGYRSSSTAPWRRRRCCGRCSMARTSWSSR